MSIQPDGQTFRQSINAKYPDLKWEGVHHAGNSSGVVDGAAAILLASKDYADKHGLKPRARIVATANIGDCPTLMLNAPVPAARKVLAKAGLTPVRRGRGPGGWLDRPERRRRDPDEPRPRGNHRGGRS